MNKKTHIATTHSISDFLFWQKEKRLILKPKFQRRSVWKNEMKSFFIDTIIRNLLVPPIILREYRDIKELSLKLEVIDGQQRLRSIFSYIDNRLLEGNAEVFKILKIHNLEYAGCAYSDLPDEIKEAILSYRFNVQILPVGVTDREVIQIFQRINSTGVKLEPQELLHAEFFGVFKSLIYKIALEQYNRLISEWKIFSANEAAKMKEATAITELVITCISGFKTLNLSSIRKYYHKYDSTFAESEELHKRISHIFDLIETHFGRQIEHSDFKKKIMFNALFLTLYDLAYGLKSGLKKISSMNMPENLNKKLNEISNKFINKTIPKNVAIVKLHSTGSVTSKKQIFEYILEQIKNG